MSALDAMTLDSTLFVQSFTRIGLMLSVMAIEMGVEGALPVGTEAIFGFFHATARIRTAGPGLVSFELCAFWFPDAAKISCMLRFQLVSCGWMPNWLFTFGSGSQQFGLFAAA